MATQEHISAGATKGNTTSRVNQKVVSIVTIKKIFGEGSGQQHIIACSSMDVVKQYIVATEEEIIPRLAKHPVGAITSIRYIIATPARISSEPLLPRIVLFKSLPIIKRLSKRRPNTATGAMISTNG